MASNAASTASVLADPAYEQLESWVERTLGLHFSEEQKPAVRRRLQGLAYRLGERSPAGLLARLSANETRLGGLVAETVATHHTAFFREPSVLDCIRTNVIPELGSRRERVRLWSAAASTGEEAYSVAMLLAEHHGARDAKARYAILATDLVQAVIQKGEAGEYSATALQSVGPQRQTSWFRPAGKGRFAVRSEIRELCTFRRLNLISKPWPFSNQFSVVLCRNVLYYFDKPTQRSLLRRVYDQIEPGGWLLTSVSESIREFGTPFDYLGPGIYRKRKADRESNDDVRSVLFSSPGSEPSAERLIVIGASTGGVDALAKILPKFPPTTPGIVVVVHMPSGYTRSFAQRLDGLCSMAVKEAEPKDRVRSGQIFIAPGGRRHLEVVRFGREYRLGFVESSGGEAHVPSVDALFRSAATAAGSRAVGLILTGMGHDGADGMVALRRAGASCFAQDEASCVVFGMPKAALERGGAQRAVPLTELPGATLDALRRRRR